MVLLMRFLTLSNIYNCESKSWYIYIYIYIYIIKYSKHYKISQFYRRKHSVSVWLEVRQWFFYRRHHRRITFVGFTFIGDSPFRRYIGRKNKKTICRWFYRRNLRAKKKKIPAWNIPTDFYSVGILWLTDGQ